MSLATKPRHRVRTPQREGQKVRPRYAARRLCQRDEATKGNRPRAVTMRIAKGRLMAKSDRPRSPFAGLDFSAQHAVRVLPYDEIERLLAAHRLYLETERRQGRRADFGSADLSGVDFAGLNLRRVK